MEPQFSDGRGSPRFDVVIPARCWARGRMLHRLVLTELSEGGCRVEGRGISLKPGDRVIVSTDVIEGQLGFVRWAAADRAGIAFSHKLYAPVVAHIVQGHQQFIPPQPHRQQRIAIV